MFALWKSMKTMFIVNKKFRFFFYAFHRPICAKWMIFNLWNKYLTEWKYFARLLFIRWFVDFVKVTLSFLLRFRYLSTLEWESCERIVHDVISSKAFCKQNETQRWLSARSSVRVYLPQTKSHNVAIILSFLVCFRFEIVKLLESLWKRPDILPSILEECGGESFQVSRVNVHT